MSGVGFGLAGVSQAETDMYHEAQTTKTLGEVAMQPFEARKKLAEAEHKELEVATERRMMEAGRRRAEERAKSNPTQGLSVSATGQSAGDMAATQLYEYAQDALDAGRPELAGKIAGSAAQVRQREAGAANNQANARLHGLQGEIQAANLIARHINSDTVKDEADWRRGWKALGMEPPAPYSADLVQEIQRSALSEHEAKTAEHQRLSRESEDRLRRARIQDLIDRKPLIKAQTEAATARAKYLGRDHGKDGTGLPKAAELKVVTDLLQQDYFNISPEEARNVGRDIAEEALAQVRRNPATNFKAVVKELYTAKQASGDLDIYGKNKPKEVTGGKVREKPLTVPVGPNGQANVAKLIKGRWYQTPKGALQWTGSVFTTESDDDED